MKEVGMGFLKRRNLETQENFELGEFESLHFVRDSKLSRPR